jgi:hypothetical protein
MGSFGGDAPLRYSSIAIEKRRRRKLMITEENDRV